MGSSRIARYRYIGRCIGGQEVALTTATDWAGRVGEVWASEWQRTDRSFAMLTTELQRSVLKVAPTAGRFVEVGGGAGSVSLAIAAARPGAEVTTIDVSPALTTVAELRAEATANLAAMCGDALAVLPALAPVDLIFSRHGMMFFADPAAALASLHDGASPGAALVFSCFRSRAENGWATETLPTSVDLAEDVDDGRPGPFAFADRRRVAALLASAGWQAAVARPVDYAYRAGAGSDPVGDACAFLSRIGPAAAALAHAAADDREARLAVLRAACERRRRGSAVDFPAAAWIWTAHA